MRTSVVLVLTLSAITLAGCNPFYSVEQSDVERGYRWISRGDYVQAVDTFKRTLERHPSSGMATLGMADALAEAGRNREAIPSYTLALERLSASGLATEAPNLGSEQVVGEMFFSYQNQGLRFPYGVAAYVYFRRGMAYEAIVRLETPAPVTFRSLAVQDFASAQRVAPSWQEPKDRERCLRQPRAAGCL
jgi:tetratricopeptide (TPR) repeat protein